MDHVGLFIVLLGLNVAVIILAWQVYQLDTRSYVPALMDNYVKSENVSGAYFPQGALVVHTNRRSMAEVKKTVDHEYLHWLIDNDAEGYEHFCEGEKD